MLVRVFLLLWCLLCAACASTPVPATRSIPLYTYTHEDGGRAHYFVIDKGVSDTPPATLVFVAPGSGCASMAPLLPEYFDGWQGLGGGTRLFVLHKRFVGAHDDGRYCSADFIAHDHPSLWLEDYRAFVTAQIAMADAGARPPQRILALGISEGGELVPQLARRVPRITHVAIVGNGGMNPRDAFYRQAVRLGAAEQALALERQCRALPDSVAAGRTCRYWNELFALNHLQALLELERPILVAMGSEDELLPVESAQFLEAEFMANGRKNLKVRVLPKANHGFFVEGRALLPYLWEALDQWLLE